MSDINNYAVNIETFLEAVIECYNGYDYDNNASLYKNYSGRFMYGSECVGVVTDNIDLFFDIARDVLDEFSDDDAYDTLKMMTRASCCSKDNMGNDYIVYWKNVNI